MLAIICGEDVSASRSYFTDLQKSYKDKGYFLQEIETGTLSDILKEEAGTFSLFEQKKAFVVSNLSKIISRKTAPDTKKAIQQVIDNPEPVILDWEAGRPAREISIKGAAVKEFKLPQNIFKLLEECNPGNLAGFIRDFHKLCEYVEPEFVFAMLSRHVRQLVLSSQGALPGTLAPWQRAKLHAQSSKWNTATLISFYEGLARIDLNLKTGRDALGVKKSVDILCAVCLR